jgi:hypothetical protein
LHLTDESGSSELCRHGLGNSGDKICFSLKKQDAETCGVNHRGDQVALDPNTLYILAKFSPTRQGLLSPKLDTSRLASYFLDYIRSQNNDLAEWYRFFALVNLTLDNTEGAIDLSQVEIQEQRLVQPLRTPGRPRGRLRFDEETEDEDEEPSTNAGGAASLSAWDQLPETPVMSDEGFSTQEERDAWAGSPSNPGTLPADLVRTIQSMQRGLEENANNLTLMHRELSGRWLLIAEDLRNLAGNQAVLQSQVNAQAAAASNAGPTGGELQELVGRVSTFLNDFPAAEERVQTLEASRTSLESTNESLRASIVNLEAQSTLLSDQLASALNIVMSLRNPPQDQANVGTNHVDLTQRSFAARDDVNAFRIRLETLESELLGLKARSSELGMIKSFADIIPNIRSVNDVEAWLTVAFGNKNGEDGNPYHDDRGVGEFLPQDDIPTFGPFTDIYVLLAICEELEGIVTKGETLKERDLIEKAGLNHPGESTVIYALKHTIPNFLSRGASNPRQTALKAVKTAADWDQVFNKDLAKGLKDVWDERQPDVEAVVRGHIEDSLSRHGHLQAASLAREMLSKSCKFTNKAFDYLSTLNRELTERSGFPLPDAWLLATEIIARICKALNTSRSEVRDISIKSTPLRNTARILYAMLRVHDMMEEYMVLEIKNHPSISSEYVKFLAAHATFKEVQGLKKKVELFEKKVPDFDRDLKKLADKVAKL